jgi:hypothetical protein
MKNAQVEAGAIASTSRLIPLPSRLSAGFGKVEAARAE